MAVINKTGITNGGTVQAEHVTRAIDALSGVSTDTIIATGSFSGSLTGLATSATSASFASTASFVNSLNQSLAITGSARITGSLGVTGSLGLNGTLAGNITGSSTLIMNLGTVGSNGNFVLPFTAPSAPARGSVYWDSSGKYLYIHDGSSWYRSLFESAGG